MSREGFHRAIKSLSLEMANEVNAVLLEYGKLMNENTEH